MSSLDVLDRILSENREFLIKHLDADNLLNDLIQLGLIGFGYTNRNLYAPERFQRASREERNRIMLEQLTVAPAVRSGIFEGLCGILKSNQQAFIAEKLEKCECKAV